jgi:uncharacterized membrane protein YagU involved in acid resistance
MGRVKPLEAMLYGAVAGALGSLAQNLFFRATRRLAPQASSDGDGEPPTQALGRRVVEGLMQRPLQTAALAKAGAIVHYSFGTAWGVAYGVTRETFPRLGTWPGTAAWSTLVWAASEHVLLPVFKLAKWPTAYPPRVHAYYWAAHLLYGAAVCNAYEALRDRPWLGAASTIAMWRRLRALPAPLRPRLRRPLLLPARARRLRDRLASAGEALRAA